MASLHCHKPAEQTLVHSQGSVVQQGYGYSETKSYSQTQYTDHGVAKTEAYYKDTETQYPAVPTNQLAHTHSHGVGTQQHHSGHSLGTHCLGHATSQATRRTHRRRNLLQRIKDGITGDSSSSSDSESDDEHCHRRNLN